MLLDEEWNDREITDIHLYKMGVETLALAIMAGCHSSDDFKLLVKMVGLEQKDSSEFDAIVDEILSQNADKVTEYKSGKTKLLGFFVGQTMKAIGGKANPAQINEMIKNKLESL
jgi:Asp-tRNA(Asn)/Glu-tRNA(Gln) amidotransferase B subunit